MQGGVFLDSVNQNLNTLYIEMLSNSPKTVTINIPEDMGKGRISQVVTKQGAVFSDWEIDRKSVV